MTAFVELHAKSAFSFGDGTATPEALVRRAAELGMPALALTDAAELGGIVRLALESERQGVRPVVGAELRVDGHPAVLLARSEQGYRNLAALVTSARLERCRGRPNLSFAQLGERARGLFALTGGASGPVASALALRGAEAAERELARWRELFGAERLAVEVQRHHAGSLERELADELIRLAGRQRLPWVVANEPRYLGSEGRLVHDLLTALRAGTDAEDALRRGLLLPNGEWRLKGAEEMARLWEGYEPGLAASAEIAEECAFSLRWVRPPLPAFPVGPGGDEDAFLRARVYEGAAKRWGAVGERQRRQIEHELRVIATLGFSGFFLIMWDAVRFARERGILCQGRGSAANSVVAYCLEITAVDPVRYDLLFERFLSEARADGLTEAPDIDVDFEAHRREEVLDYVYGRYGRERAAITAVTQVYSAPTAVQDAMRALGYPVKLAFALSKRLHGKEAAAGAEALERELAEAHGLDLAEGRGRALLAAMRALQDVPRMRSTHPGGFVLSSRPLGERMPIERTTLGRTILQFDKDDLDATGTPKFDFLGLGGLSAIRLAFDAIEARTGKRLELYDLPQDDPETFAMIQRGDTVGTFQVESRAQIQSLVQTRPQEMYDLVVQVALIRPGPIQAEFVRPYVRRRRGLERTTFLHPALEPILGRTCGIPIFQEQAMAISMALGGYSAAEADELRRSMGHQRKAERLRANALKLRERMVERGVAPEVADKITQDLKVFSAYGFPESHAWSFALIAYATCWLRAHRPAEFLLGLLNAQPMGFYSPATLVNDALRRGVEVRPPCLKRGEWDATLEETDDPERPALRVGWRQIRGLGERAREALQRARREGPFASIEEVVRRAALGRAEALHLARAGALEAFEPGRRAAAWEALRAAGDVLPLAPAGPLPFRPRELEGDERIFLDYLSTGVSIQGHPVRAIRERLRSFGALSSRELLEEARDGSPVVTGGLVIVRQHPVSANGVVFLLLEDEEGMINIVVHPKLFEKQKEVIRYTPFLLVEGKLDRNEEVLNVVARRFVRLEVEALAHRSRDFR